MRLFDEWDGNRRLCVVCGLLLAPIYDWPEPDPADLPDDPLRGIMIAHFPGPRGPWEVGPFLVHEKCDPAYEWPEPDAAMALFVATGRGWRRWTSTAV